MKLTFTLATCFKELEQILTLQRINHFSNVTSETKVNEGFVTVLHTLSVLDEMNRVCPHILAKDGDLVVGYALCMHRQFALKIAVLKPMFEEIDAVLPKDLNYIVMGQICVSIAYRKKGVFKGLYHKMKASIEPKFDCILTEVDALNTRSLNAHYAIGFTHIKTYFSSGQEWNLLRLN